MLVSSRVIEPEIVGNNSSASTHLHFLDGLRALAALYVVVHHASMQVPLQWDSFVHKVLYKLANEGHYAVDLFIVLSGFCLMLPIVRNQGVLKEGSWQFFKKRARRILPPYYFALGFTLLLIFTVIGEKTGTHWDYTLPVTNWDIFTRLTLLQDVFLSTKSKVNYVFWSISVEWRIYLLFPFLVVCWRKRGPFFTTVLAVILSFVLWFVLEPTGLNLGKTGISPHYIGLFCLGMLATQFAYSREDQFVKMRETTPWSMLLLSSFVITTIAHILRVHWVFLDLIVGSTAGILLVAVASGKFKLMHRLLSWQPLVFIGTFAYSIYLVHAPLLQLISQYLLQPLHLSILAGFIFMLSVGTFLSVSASYLFFLIAERPFIRKKKTIAAKGVSGAEAPAKASSAAEIKAAP